MRMNPVIWKALFVSDERAVAHVWEPSPKDGHPNALRALCGAGVIADTYWLEPERAHRQHCKRCQRVLAKMKKEGKA